MLRCVAIVCLLCAAGAAQVPDLEPGKPVHNPTLPTVTFTYEMTGAVPSHYAVSVESTGRAAYLSDSPEDENINFATPGKPSSGEPYMMRFVIAQATADRIFALAKKLNYFNGNFDYTKSRVANTGSKTLIYGDPTRHYETTYNWSQTQDIMALTKIFQNLSATLEFERRLDFDMRYQKLALDADLNQLQEAAGHNDVGELQLLTPTLQKIVDDSSVMHIARKRAQALLASISGGASGQP